MPDQSTITLDSSAIELGNGENLRALNLGDRVDLDADTGHGGAWTVAEFHGPYLERTTLRAAVTPCWPPYNPCEDGGESCERHERETSHADGEHELCGDECPKAPCAEFVPDAPRAPGLCATCGDSKAWHRTR